VYLNTHRTANELYHENYDSVAVMFATLTNYTLCDDEDQTCSELRSLEILNQIICDFDNKVNICFLASGSSLQVPSTHYSVVSIQILKICKLLYFFVAWPLYVGGPDFFFALVTTWITTFAVDSPRFLMSSLPSVCMIILGRFPAHFLK